MSLSNIGETELWSRWVRHRDEAAATELWDRHQRLAVAVAARVLRPLPDAYLIGQGIADEGFFRALQTFSPERAPPETQKPFRNWLLFLVRNAAIDYRRRWNPAEEPHSEPPDPSHNPEAKLVDTHDLRALLPRLKAYVLEHYLDEDWAVMEQWMLHRSDGGTVPWRALSHAHPVKLDLILPFADHAVFTGSGDAIAHAAHVLNSCPNLQISVVGFTAVGEAPALAERRASMARDAIEALLSRRKVRGERRLSVSAVLEDGPPRVELKTIRGRHHSPDALRMRIEKVILPRALTSLRPPLSRGET